MGRLSFSSVLRSEYRDDLEALIFFNPQQERVEAAVIQCIEKYGKLGIAVDGELLRVRVEGLADIQSLFAFDGAESQATDRLVGLIVYVRPNLETIVVLHVAV